MGILIYNLIIIGLGIAGLLSGFRRGLTGQVCSILGFAFGSVCAHAFSAELVPLFREWLPGVEKCIGSSFVYSVVAAGTVYAVVYGGCVLLTGVLRRALALFRVGILDSVFGAAFGCFKYMIFVSLVFNAIVCVFPSSSLVKSGTASDGNLVECVMAIAPWALGSMSFEDYALMLQLHEARKIS